MVSNQLTINPSSPTSAPYPGPRDNDPLTEGELSILLSVPRAAQATPNAILFRLPLGPDPNMGWVDVTCAEVYSIVSRLAAQWNAKLSALSSKRTAGTSSSIGPAFWALGCSIQYISAGLGDDVLDGLLEQSGCRFVLHSGVNDAWVTGWSGRFDGDIIELPHEEQAHRLALAERNSKARGEPIYPWPAPRRPTPAVIIHSSASTGAPKLMKFSLYFYTIGIPLNCQNYLSLAHPNLSKSKSPYTHPRLLFTPPYWQSFFCHFFVHLITATPVAIAHVSDICALSSDQFMTWAKGLDVGSTACGAYFLRDVLTAGRDSDIKFLQGLCRIGVAGSVVDDQLSLLFQKLQLPVTNLFGLSEFDRVLHAPRAPYTHLRPFCDLPPPLALPVSGSPDSPSRTGLRQVQLWYTVSSSPHLAHLVTQGGVPLKLEPFPGEGPYFGELAVNWGDVFQEVQVPSNTIAGGYEVAYINLGRSDDILRFSVGAEDDMNASNYEGRLRTILECRLKPTPWKLDTVQLFGSALPCTAVIIQLDHPNPTEVLGEATLKELHASVDEANRILELGPRRRVHWEKRVLVITPGGRASGSGAKALEGKEVRLAVTHKHTLRRWANTQMFQPWLEGLDYSDP